MRLVNSIKNLKYNFLALIVNLLVQFISRTVFIWILGKEYLGLDGLLSNILTILSLADMGIGTVLVYALYDPLARENHAEIRQLIKAYDKIYKIIAMVVFSLGVCVIPFLSYLANEISNIHDLTLIYMLYLANTVVSYLFVHKISIINADQKNYLVTLNRQVFLMISSLTMTATLVITKNFIGYLAVQIVFTVLANIRISRIADELYPFLKEHDVEKISLAKKRQIYRGAAAMILHKLGGVVVSGTDNLLMSIMIGLNAVGMYSNYLLITTAIRKIIDTYSTSIVASVGNLGTEKDISKMYIIFRRVVYSNFVIVAFCATCLFCLLNHFIRLWLGEGFVFDTSIVAAIVGTFYISGMRQAVLCFIEALGLFVKNKMAPVIEVICNLILSVVLAWRFGVIGIILGTALSQLFVCTFWEAWIVYRYGFRSKMRGFVYLYIQRAAIVVLDIVFVSYISNMPICGGPTITFAVRAIVTVFLSATILTLCTCHSAEFRYFAGLLKSKILRQ